MRDFKGMKRQRGRNRPGGGGGGGGGKPGGGGNANRAFDSNGPEHLKVRGSAQHIYEKYTQLARDAGAGDRVLLENYLQHAEHYYRLIRTLQPQRTPAEIMGRDNFTSGYDIDFEDEAIEAQQAAANLAGEAAAQQEEAQAEAQPQDGGAFRDRERPREDRPYRDRDDRPRDREFRDGQPRGDREFRDRDDRPRGDREFRDRDGQPRADREFRDRDGQPRADREFRDRDGPRPERGPRPDRFERDRDRPREGRYGERPEGRFGERPREDAPRDAASEVETLPRAVEPSGDEDGRMLRDQEGGFSPAPAFLQAAAPPADGEGRPRRRRRSRDADEAPGEGAAPAAPDSEEG